MKLNGIDCDWYDVTGKDTVEFGIATDFTGALALDGARLAVTHDDGETEVAVFDGYALTGIVSGSDGGVRASFARALPDSTAHAIRGAEESARGAGAIRRRGGRQPRHRARRGRTRRGGRRHQVGGGRDGARHGRTRSQGSRIGAALGGSRER